MFTGNFTVASVTPSQVFIRSCARRVVIGEDASVTGFPTTDWLLYLGSLTNLPKRIPAGGTYVLDLKSGNFTVGPISMWAKTITGSTTFFQEEVSGV